MDIDGATDSDIWPANPGSPPHVIAILGVYTHGAVHHTEFDSVPSAPGFCAVRIPTCFGNACYRNRLDEVGNRRHKYADRRQGYHF